MTEELKILYLRTLEIREVEIRREIHALQRQLLFCSDAREGLLSLGQKPLARPSHAALVLAAFDRDTSRTLSVLELTTRVSNLNHMEAYAAVLALFRLGLLERISRGVYRRVSWQNAVVSFVPASAAQSPNPPTATGATAPPSKT